MEKIGVRGGREAVIGWLYVVGHFAFLGVVLVAPPGGLWPVGPALGVLSVGLMGAGVVLFAASAVTLGRSFTPLPAPSARSELQVAGLYRWVRHPVYSSFMLVALGGVLRSASVVSILAMVAMVACLMGKARREERFLLGRYPGYADYAAGTPRFVPLWPVR